MRYLSLAAVTMSLLASSEARADEWRYCLATATSGNTIYVSNAFESAAPLEILQRKFAEALEQKQYHASGIQCPRGGSSDVISSDIARLVSYQKALGNRISQVDWPSS